VISTIVVPLDGSALAARAVPFAVHLAARTKGELVLLRATQHVNPVFVPHPEALVAAASHEQVAQREAAADRWELAQSLRDQELVVHVALAAGVPELAILDAVRTRPASLIVMATHGEGGLGRMIYGSAAVEVLRHTPVPVLLVPAACDHRWPEMGPLRVLVPLDGSALAETILDPIGALTGVLNIELHILRVVPTVGRKASATRDIAQTYRELARRRLAALSISASTHIVIGDPAESIDTVARRLEVDVIAMATHGRTGLARVVLGSVAEQTLHRARVPLLLVRPPLDRLVSESPADSGITPAESRPA